MHNYRTQRTDPASLVVNQRIVEAHVNSEHYVRWKYPSDIELETGVINVAARDELSQREHWIDMPDGVTTNVYWKLARPEQWRRGLIEIVLVYSGSASSTNPFLISIRQMLFKAGSNISTTGPTLNTTVALAGPAAANDVLVTTWTAYLPIDPQWLYVSCVLTRTGGSGSDTNTGLFRLLAVRHRYVPGQHVA